MCIKLKIGSILVAMKKIKEKEALGINAVKKLRRNRLSRGDFFMINLNSLPPDHCYLEFPGGIIKLAICEPGAKDFTIVRELENEEGADLRKKFDLELIH